jgi:tetratricopeptide (TPR) repeat protein
MRSYLPISHMRYPLLVATLLLLSVFPLRAQDATVTESLQKFRTYPFSDPDPVARMGNIYPYFRFQGYSMTPVERQWKIVTLENRWIRVLLAPEIGGKILGAIEKSTGKTFIYYNRVIKFREIAMRGPWTSGGIEFNFGDIGHTPTTATPVDYLTRTNADGSVSCIVGALDLPSRTEWRVEIRLPRDKAMFETRSFWYNPTPLTTSRYHWMNAAADADSTLQVIYPGTAYIGHAGEVGEWPVDRKGRDLTWYRNNAFGSYKSYHVLGSYTDYFGARWNDFGVIHWSRYTDKPGKKLWIWGLSREGEIWKGLLTDSALGNTQYVELQSGLHFNQAMMQSSRTPFKHMAFLPQTADRFTEAWFPFKGLDQVTQATPDGVLDVKRSNGKILLSFCPTGPFRGIVSVVAGGTTLFERPADLQPLQTYKDSVIFSGRDVFEIHVGDLLHYRSSEDSSRTLERPIKEEAPFNWSSSYGLVVDARERVRQRDMEGALVSYRAALKSDPALLPALSGVAELYIRKLEYDSALGCAKAGLAVDAYDPEANYLYGLVQRHRGRLFDAQDGLGVAARSTSSYQAAALVQLAEMAFVDQRLTDAEDYARRASEVDGANVPSLQLLAIISRFQRDTTAAERYLDRILALDPLNNCARFERFRLSPTDGNRLAFVGMVRNELPHESFMELAALYMRISKLDDAHLLLSISPRHAMVEFWRGYCAAKAGRDEEAKRHLDEALATSPSLVFPHRQEDWDVLQWAHRQANSWKTGYYLAMLSWSLGRIRDTEAYFTECGDAPDYAPFYLARGSFQVQNANRALADYRRAVVVGPEEWRTYNVLASFLNTRGAYNEALSVCSKGAERFPQSYVLKFLQARTLLFNAHYRQSLAILDTLAILPFEGARFGREAYRQVCVMTAVDTLRQSHADAALALLGKAKLWPERLGAGKPYDVDNRIEDYLASRVMRKKGDRSAAERLLGAVNRFTIDHKDVNSAQQLIGALALREAGRDSEARDLLVSWTKREPGSAFARWAVAFFWGRRRQAEQLFRSMQQTTMNKFSGDQEAVLVAEVVRRLVTTEKGESRTWN